MSQPVSQGLTTTRAPFIEQARANGDIYIRQPYELYSEENHQTWRQLFTRMRERWRRYANEKYLHGLDTLFMDQDHVPRFEDVNRFMQSLTGFRTRPVSGCMNRLTSSSLGTRPGENCSRVRPSRKRGLA